MCDQITWDRLLMLRSMGRLGDLVRAAGRVSWWGLWAGGRTSLEIPLHVLSCVIHGLSELHGACMLFSYFAFRRSTAHAGEVAQDVWQ